jgi:palmitoyltransferase
VALFIGDSEIKHSAESSKHSHIQAVVYFFLMLVTGLLFLRTSTIDPGWIVHPSEIKKRADGMSVEVKGETSKERSSWLSVLCPCFFPETPWAAVASKEEPVDPSCRFCPSCNLWQKLRSKHCNLCNRCVAKYDHHCFWMGNCIGEKNHGLFWWFLFLESGLIIWTIYLLIDELTRADAPTVQSFLEHSLLSCLVLGMIIVVGWLPMALLGLHTYLISTNQTTWEFNRRDRITYLHSLPDGVHPFSQDGFKGWLANLDLICCDMDPTPRPWRRIATDIGKI